MLSSIKKRSSNSQGYKKIAIASIHKLIRTMFALTKHNQLYNYQVATHNQRLQLKSNNQLQYNNCTYSKAILFKF